MSSSTLPVVFRNTTLSLIEHNGEPFVAMKPVVTGMGLAWEPQAEKLRSNATRWGMTMIVIPSTSGEQQTTCMPLRKLPGWLSTISPNRVKPALRETILAFQNECDDVLWQHWNQHHPRETPSLEQVVLQSVVGQRWLIYFDHLQHAHLIHVPADAVVIQPDKLPELLADPGSNFRLPLMPAIIDAAVKRLSGPRYR